jgi:hypothetical protein
MGQSAFPEGNTNDRLIGSALLSNTTACEASRLFLSPIPAEYYAPMRICDLMSLIDSVVLHERIYYLPASLPDDVHRLELRNRLVEIGALTSLPRGDDHNLIGQALLASLSTVSGFRKVGGAASEIGTPLSFEDFRPPLMKVLGLTTVAGQIMDSNPAQHDERWDYLDYYKEAEGNYSQVILAEAESFAEAARDLISWLDYPSSGAYEDSLTSLRAMYYVFASEHYSLPYIASVGVQRMQRKFPNYFKPSVREKLYQQLAAALETTVNTVAQDFDGPIFFIPPFSALVLNRAATPAEIPSEILALRAEYSDFRGKMSELERDRLEARSLNDRMRALRQIERLGKEVTRSFDEPSQVKLESALRYIPDAVELAANPTNPTGWARALLGLPTEALLSWYRRRPVAKLVRAGRAVGSLPGYDSLLKKHFGDASTSKALEFQSTFQET